MASSLQLAQKAALQTGQLLNVPNHLEVGLWRGRRTSHNEAPADSLLCLKLSALLL